MHSFSYDHTFEGFLTAVFEVYAHRAQEVTLLRAGEAPPLFSVSHTEVQSDAARASRVATKITTLCGHDGLRTFWKAWLSAQQGMDGHCLQAMRYVFAKKTNVLQDYGNVHVLRIREAEKQMYREAHRMEAFVRFRRTEGDLYIATVEPDFNVLPVIAPHFTERYADQRWMIYDVKRQYGIYYDLHTVCETSLTMNETETPLSIHSDEDGFEQLWKEYFRSVNIPLRKNAKLHLQHVPRRYWKFLTEKQVGI